MRKKKFRIIIYNKNNIPFYETKVKTWIGWVSFTVFYKSDIVHILSEPLLNKQMVYERIKQYCKTKGYTERDIEITEINSSKPGKWNIFWRIC